MYFITFIRTHLRTLGKLYFFVFFLFLFHILLGFIFVYQTSIRSVERKLNTLTGRIEKDLRYTNGKWDMTLYTADPMTPYPNGSSGFTNPLYIITDNGFVIERSQPIRGVLDTSDFEHLIRFEKPMTLDTNTNEKWRVYSEKIIDNESVLGVIVVSYYNPKSDEVESIDIHLQETAKEIRKSIITTNGQINTGGVDIRNIHYEFSFEVVDRYNKVLLNNGRVPTFIDPSYFDHAIKQAQNRIVKDQLDDQPFILNTRILSFHNKPIAVIVAGESVSGLYLILKNFLIFSVVMSLILVVPLVFYTFMMLRNEFTKLFSKQATQNIFDEKLSTIQFDKKQSSIILNKTVFPIPFASNQFYVCEAIFAYPHKKWEYDELLSKMGENIDEASTRKVYDATIAINKRVGIKLIKYKSKVFYMNPEYISLLKKT